MANTETAMSIDEIFEYLPHRPPFLLVDRVEEWRPYEYIRAIKNATINEVYFAGHFPGRPVMPGVLILEAAAQAAAILAFKSANEKPGPDSLYYFAGIDKARFKKIVQPGDQMVLEIFVKRAKAKIWQVYCTVKVNDELVCSADLMSVKK
jgi:3-hydroxyacyl-[acyl-carrier-protein] dehydratase